MSDPQQVTLMRTKIVLNSKYGGFGLSPAAMKLGAELSGDPRWGMGEYDELVIERHDPILVAVVEKLGPEADGICAKLRVEEISIGYAYDDHDGKESLCGSGW